MTACPQGGGPRPPITNAAFLAAIFCDRAPSEALWTCTFSNPPSREAPWAGYPLIDIAAAPERPRSNTYFAVSSLRADNQGKYSRRLDNFARLHVVVLDDSPAPASLPPTWILETSRPEGRSNTQVGYRLARPIDDLALARQLHQALATAGHIGNDRSGNNAVRYVRLPVGANTKHRPAHPHRLLHFDPTRAVTLEELVAALGLDLTTAAAPRPPGVAAQRQGSSNATHGSHLPATPGATRAAPSGQQGGAASFFRAVNDAALSNLAAWVPELLPAARPYHAGYRISSRDLGRDLEEDLSILPAGIRDFGEEITKTAIDLTLEHGPATTATEAALWLCASLAIDPAALGWRPSPYDDVPPPGDEDAPLNGTRHDFSGQDGDLHAHNFGSSVSLLSNQDFSLSQVFRKCLAEEASVSHGCLIDVNAKEEKTRMIDSKAAEVIAAAVRGILAWDAEAASWLLWVGTHWHPLTTPAPAEKILADAVHIGTQPLGYRLAYLTGITAIICRRGLLPPPHWPAHVVPFANGLLDLKTHALRPATPDNALNWCLPHAWDPQADCPTIKAWLRTAVEHDEESVQLLRAWLAALVRGLSLQNFLYLIGRGGSGKGTLQRLAMALVGTSNAAISTLRDLEENRFETAKLYGKRLAMINEAGHYGGGVNMLKAVTGGDHLPLERKHVQQSGTFQFGGLVMMASNEQLTSTDATSGLERRRITVRFPRSATPDERAEWQARGGEQAVLHREIPGLIRWLLEMPEKEIHHRINHPPSRVLSDNLSGLAAGNSVANWLLECTIPGKCTGKEGDPFATQIGCRKERRESGAIVYEHHDSWLYPNYLTWCDSAGRKPVSLTRFSAIVLDIGEHMGQQIHRAQHPRERSYYLYGLRLRQPWEDPFDWEASAYRGLDPSQAAPPPPPPVGQHAMAAAVF